MFHNFGNRYTGYFMIKKVFLFLTGIIFVSVTVHDNFLTEQMRYERVRIAINPKKNGIQEKLKEKGLTHDNFNMLLVAYKEENRLEVYVKNKQESICKKYIRTQYTPVLGS